MATFEGAETPEARAALEAVLQAVRSNDAGAFYRTFTRGPPAEPPSGAKTASSWTGTLKSTGLLLALGLLGLLLGLASILKGGALADRRWVQTLWIVK